MIFTVEPMRFVHIVLTSKLNGGSMIFAQLKFVAKFIFIFASEALIAAITALATSCQNKAYYNNTEKFGIKHLV